MTLGKGRRGRDIFINSSREEEGEEEEVTNRTDTQGEGGRNQREATSHLVADLGTDGASPDPIHQLTGVTVVPVLAHELLLCHCERTQLAVQRLLIL